MKSLQNLLAYEPVDAFLDWKLPGFDVEKDLAHAANVSVDVLRFMIAFFSSCFAALVLRHLLSPVGRQLYSAVIGVVLCAYVFGNGITHAFVLILLNWLILRTCPQRACMLAWAINFPYLIVCSIKAGDTWKRGDLDFIGGIMIILLKMVSLGTSRENGFWLQRKSAGALSEYDQAQVLTYTPSLFELTAYTFANGNLLGGPYFDYKSWDEFIHRTGPFHEALCIVEGRRPPSPLLPGAQKVAMSLLYLGVHVALSHHVSLDLIFAPDFRSKPLYHKLATLWMVGLVARLKFYFVWTLSEASLILAGFGFNGWKDPETRHRARWDRHTNGYPLKIETADSVAQLMLHWNSQTSAFLRRYVYEKFTFGQKSPGFRSLLLTNIVSAMWHGVQASYLLLFGTAAAMVEASRFIYQQEQRLPKAVWGSLPWRIVKTAWTLTVMNYSCLAFHLYDLKKLFEAWGKFDYFPHLVLLALLLLRCVVPRPRGGTKKADAIVEDEKKQL